MSEPNISFEYTFLLMSDHFDKCQHKFYVVLTCVRTLFSPYFMPCETITTRVLVSVLGDNHIHNDILILEIQKVLYDYMYGQQGLTLATTVQ